MVLQAAAGEPVGCQQRSWLASQWKNLTRGGAQLFQISFQELQSEELNQFIYEYCLIVLVSRMLLGFLIMMHHVSQSHM